MKSMSYFSLKEMQEMAKNRPVIWVNMEHRPIDYITRLKAVTSKETQEMFNDMAKGMQKVAKDRGLKTLVVDSLNGGLKEA